MQRNLRLYPAYYFLANLYFWLPVFFLYFSSVLSLERVLQLEAIYYLSVVLMEVPSGYFSDRIGRKVTLIISAVGWIAAYAVFAATSSFAWFAVAQFLLASGFAFASGTDSSLLYDSLVDLGREDEQLELESRAHSLGFIAMAISAIGGGLAASFDLRLAYALSALGGVVCLGVVFRMQEPARHHESTDRTLLTDLGRTLGRLRHPVLLWVFALSVGMTVLNHVPYEFFQSYLDFLVTDLPGVASDRTPLATGGMLAATMLISSWFARKTKAMQARFSEVGSLLAMVVLQGAIIGLMGWMLHPVVVLLILFRSVPGAVMKPMANALIHPRIGSEQRATYLSIQSLVGRLAFSGALFAASLVAGPLGEITYPVMSRILVGFGGGAIGLLVILGITALPVLRRIREETKADG